MCKLKSAIVLIELVILLLTGKSKEAVDLGICDFSGQGRNKYGI